MSTLLYAAECWSLTERDEAKLDAFHMQCQRKILRIVWSQHASNKRIRSLTKQPQLSNVIRNCRLKWFGHLLKMDNKKCEDPKEAAPLEANSWKMEVWPCGQPRTIWADVQRDLGFGWSVEEAEIAAQDQNCLEDSHQSGSQCRHA